MFVGESLISSPRHDLFGTGILILIRVVETG